ncbi:MAG: hypothetical protein FJ143_03225 [Deltaproteobacteria bacterium]|nr:hypothetical protein [Deltaproteobacteria bacterium]
MKVKSIMRNEILTKLLTILLAAWWLSGTSALAADAGPALLKAKKDADARGYTFITSHNEIVNKAKQEGRLRVLAEMEPPTIKAAIKAFTAKYPFINLYIEEITGTGAAQYLGNQKRHGQGLGRAPPVH